MMSSDCKSSIALCSHRIVNQSNVDDDVDNGQLSYVVCVNDVVCFATHTKLAKTA